MRILILSDLHREVWSDSPKQSQELLKAMQPNLDISRPDLVILAGDIDVGDRAVAWADQTFPSLPVIYVPGNHEAYGQKIDTLKAKLAKACSATGHVYFLDRGELVMGGVRFLGATLWTDFQLLGEDNMQEAMQFAGSRMNDYRKIRLAKAGYRKIKALDVAQWHWEDRVWLQQRLEKPFNGLTVVVTHMAPSSRSIPERYVGQIISAAFASDLDDVVSRADLWVHGHLHDSMDYQQGNARVICNPLGYPHRNSDGSWHRENASYDPNLVVELKAIEPARQILGDAAARRDELSREWLDATQVSSRLGRSPESGGNHASQLRRAGQLLGVYVEHPLPGYRYPLWQFRPDGHPVDHLAETLMVLREFGPFEREPEGLRRTTGWGEVEWFMSPHALLGGATPAAVLTDDPARVLRAAQIEFEINDR
ncbi:metallophosphoesterase [Stenotrophomonas maltophilia]|uniref:metallophosphoesterase n=1 Tax=Stenotrophomonas maltophilia TaxID=40324 RepID=UPI001F2F7F97|nr:metallophosphoesterase [Stenotrophomonas maltophilia]MCF3468842.1 hypothetical protein [Stenotrophomonas maltophilia]